MGVSLQRLALVYIGISGEKVNFGFNTLVPRQQHKTSQKMNKIKIEKYFVFC
jgi:hypothetical protein